MASRRFRFAFVSDHISAQYTSKLVIKRQFLRWRFWGKHLVVCHAIIISQAHRRKKIKINYHNGVCNYTATGQGVYVNDLRHTSAVTQRACGFTGLLWRHQN